MPETRWKAHVTTEWITHEGTNVFKLCQDHPLPPGGSCMDVTAQQSPVPDWPGAVAEVWVPQSYLDAVRDDPAYGPAAIIWWEEIPGDD